MPPQSGPDQCALDENGQLRDAEDIPWFNSPSDKDPIPLPPNTALQDILAAERLDEWGDLDKKHRQRKPHSKRNTKRVKVMDNSSDLDPDDDEYQTDTADSTSEASNASQDEISNGELANALSSKTLPQSVRRSQPGKRKRPEQSAVDDAQPSHATTPSLTLSSSFVMDGSSKETKQVSPLTSNPIYYFYEAIHSAPQGIKAEEGDKFYQCYHGGRKILRVTKKMRYNLNEDMVVRSKRRWNLKSCSPDMFKFYSYLRDRATHIPLSPEEKGIALGKIELSAAKLAEFTQRHDAHQQSLKNAFARQQEKAAVSRQVFMPLSSSYRHI
ncbi:hypothetical protein BC826DRAFT_921532 [Russula brevipes]|nr:hypothetical protein BC826DRAFT_921532 [Russula brevipes]